MPSLLRIVGLLLALGLAGAALTRLRRTTGSRVPAAILLIVAAGLAATAL